MKKYKWLIISLNLLLVLVMFNRNMFLKEHTISDGQLVLFELAPVDPRSLMQGDYMRLNYAIANDEWNSSVPEHKRGYCIITLDKNQVAKRVRLQQEKTPLHAGEIAIRYNLHPSQRISIGAESFFFQEGEAKKYEKAAYGALKIDSQGNSVLIGLSDIDKKLIK